MLSLGWSNAPLNPPGPDGEVIRPMTNPIHVDGGIAVLSGSLAPMFDIHPNCGYGGASAEFLNPATGQPDGLSRPTVCRRS